MTQQIQISRNLIGECLLLYVTKPTKSTWVGSGVTQRGEEFCKEVVDAMDARMKSKNPKTVALTIALLDTMEKNCNGFFHKAVCQKEFLDNLFKIAIEEQVFLESRTSS